MKHTHVPLDFVDPFDISRFFETDPAAVEMLFVTGVFFDTAGFVVAPSRCGAIVDCTNGVVLLLLLIVGGKIGVVDCFTERTITAHITVRRGPQIVNEGCSPEVPVDGFGDGSFVTATGGFGVGAFRVGALRAGAGFDTEDLEGGKIGGRIGGSLGVSLRSNDTRLSDSCLLPLEDPAETVRMSSGDELAAACEDGAFNADFLPEGMKGVDD
jgi:hypothetical protein